MCRKAQLYVVKLQQTHCDNVKFCFKSHPFLWWDAFLDRCSNKRHHFLWRVVVQRRRKSLDSWTLWKQAILSSCFWFRKKGGTNDKQTPLSYNNQCWKKRTSNRPSFLSAFDAERKEERRTNRISFLSTIDAERKEERKTNRPSFLSVLLAERKEERTTNRRSFFTAINVGWKGERKKNRPSFFLAFNAEKNEE